MFYENWMSYIKDDAKLTNIAIPGSHNAGTRGMVAQIGRASVGKECS